MKHAVSRRLRTVAGWVLALVVGGMAGYWVRDYRTLTAKASGSMTAWGLDDFVRPRSFSPVEASRAELEGLAQLYRAEARTRLLKAEAGVLPAMARRSETIADLERGWEAFRDTSGEAVLVQDLLLLLKKSGDHSRWLGVYLDVAYRRPTEELIGLFADDALEIAGASGRLPEVTAALRHVLEIPIEFPGKRRLEAPVATVSHSDSREVAPHLL
ncbi:MAG: hypothetical protein J0L84_09395 [Verrucomicrobia bacterium]|nr:hypothetical protein [Verrucomicrobiota bacterium]